MIDFVIDIIFNITISSYINAIHIRYKCTNGYLTVYISKTIRSVHLNYNKSPSQYIYIASGRKMCFYILKLKSASLF